MQARLLPEQKKTFKNGLHRLVSGWIVTGIIFGLLLVQPAAAQENGPDTQGGKTPQVEQALLQTFETQLSSDYVIVMGQQADLSAAYEIEDWDERGQYVVDTLQAFARESQKDVIADLEAQGIRYQSFFAGNEIYVYGGTQRSLQTLQAHTEVGSIRAPVQVNLDAPTLKIWQIPAAATGPQSAVNSTVTWGLTSTGAPVFWNTTGATGQGIIVANIDTGVQYDHPALMNAYRCKSNPTSPTCWKDTTAICSGSIPCDDNGHGTHTMGTMVASNNSSLAYMAGMAPGATWIACKACAGTKCADLALLACADWILAPGGNSNNRPQVVNNSWGGTGGDNWFQSKVQAWRAAGIFPSFSAGNTGSGCATLGSPGDYPESFSSGSYNSSGAVSSFSSRGPGEFGDIPYTKPNISAPGEAVLSTYPGDSWAYGNGTSMASPHTAGAVALLWSWIPGLRGNIGQTFQLLQNNAAAVAPNTICGMPAEGDYASGYGHLNVQNVMNAVQTGVIHGQVTRAGQPVAGVRVQASQAGIVYTSAVTDSSGYYTMKLVAGTYFLAAVRYGYSSENDANITVNPGDDLIKNFSMTILDPVNLHGTVTDGSGRGGPLAARLTFTAGQDEVYATTDTLGTYSIDLFQNLSYTIQVEALYEDYLPKVEVVTFSGSSANRDYVLMVNPLTCQAEHYIKTSNPTACAYAPYRLLFPAILRR